MAFRDYNKSTIEASIHIVSDRKMLTKKGDEWFWFRLALDEDAKQLLQVSVFDKDLVCLHNKLHPGLAVRVTGLFQLRSYQTRDSEYKVQPGIIARNIEIQADDDDLPF